MLVPIAKQRRMIMLIGVISMFLGNSKKMKSVNYQGIPGFINSLSL